MSDIIKPETQTIDLFLRRLERERKLRQIERKYQNIAEEAKQTQEDIYINVFTEKGQEETFATYDLSRAPRLPPDAFLERGSRFQIWARHVPKYLKRVVRGQ